MASLHSSRKILDCTTRNVPVGCSCVYIDGYTYTAVNSRDVTQKTGISNVTTEDGLNRSDNVYKEPTDLSYSIIVSKLNVYEYEKLKELYVNRKIVSVHSIGYNFNHCMLTGFEVVDDHFDTMEIKIKVSEILYGNTEELNAADERFQLVNTNDETYNMSCTGATDALTSDATASLDNAFNTQENLSGSTMTTTGASTAIQMGTFEGNTTLAGKISTTRTEIYNDTADSLKQNNDYIDNSVNKFSSIIE